MMNACAFFFCWEFHTHSIVRSCEAKREFSQPLHGAQEASFKKGDARQGAAAPKKKKKDVAGFEPTIEVSKTPVLTNYTTRPH